MAPTLYLTEQGATLSRRGERLVVELEGEPLADVPASKVLPTVTKIEVLLAETVPPPARKVLFCKKCAYAKFCWS